MWPADLVLHGEVTQGCSSTAIAALLEQTGEEIAELFSKNGFTVPFNENSPQTVRLKHH
jgi:hypothetical protein